MSINLTEVELYCVIRTCREKRDRIGYEIDKLLNRYASSLSEADYNAMLVLDGERYVVERVLAKLYSEAQARTHRKRLEIVNHH